VPVLAWHGRHTRRSPWPCSRSAGLCRCGVPQADWGSAADVVDSPLTGGTSTRISASAQAGARKICVNAVNPQDRLAAGLQVTQTISATCEGGFGSIGAAFPYLRASTA
jgi:hypothetical protein